MNLRELGNAFMFATVSDTMIIMISAYDWSSIEEEARDAGIDCFVAKPLFRSVIYDAFTKMADKEAQERKPVLSGLDGCRILLVEDNKLNQEIARTLLEMEEAVVEVAENGEIAVESFRNREPGYYQVILMDKMCIRDRDRLVKS